MAPTIAAAGHRIASAGKVHSPLRPLLRGTLGLVGGDKRRCLHLCGRRRRLARGSRRPLIRGRRGLLARGRRGLLARGRRGLLARGRRGLLARGRRGLLACGRRGLLACGSRRLLIRGAGDEFGACGLRLGRGCLRDLRWRLVKLTFRAAWLSRLDRGQQRDRRSRSRRPCSSRSSRSSRCSRRPSRSSRSRRCSTSRCSSSRRCSTSRCSSSRRCSSRPSSSPSSRRGALAAQAPQLQPVPLREPPVAAAGVLPAKLLGRRRITARLSAVTHSG